MYAHLGSVDRSPFTVDRKKRDEATDGLHQSPQPVYCLLPTHDGEKWPRSVAGR
jgi:hypothetical protein